MGVRVVFLLNCPLILSLLKYKGVKVFMNQENMISKGEAFFIFFIFLLWNEAF